MEAIFAGNLIYSLASQISQNLVGSANEAVLIKI